MGVRGRAMSESMAKALADLEGNPDQTINEVADRWYVSRNHFRLHVNNRELPYKRERKRRNEALRLSSPAYAKISPEEQQLLDMRKAELERERASAPAEVRMKHQLTNTFERLTRLWGDWIKK